jgi:hypothetical protein
MSVLVRPGERKLTRTVLVLGLSILLFSLFGPDDEFSIRFALR